ncbi:hypothetical protein BX616_000831 [Lobosporangium transversale]|uniref:Uncharacterized protein n=1 Tax=Lobosporangium transversale TaxID=64571 RepID=A0A1Y2H228_9FUNG|nr:hypothetical protein BCR41DRAFT_418999 [Lobosporangium transversale]KAF9919143.1 hypothetical protein BX616_000831 [Lobosporangium transversale]ORZ28041.1 hypothetical protein BCR41DRAFT_418999 [Lobosporangium transversale]|eukprot:XP_021885744.1 hypothetical protein BCR41DRAFT_418999 [Lobosporangium transversale]
MMMNLKTTALLGNITRQTVSRQLAPISNSKNQVINLTQRTAQPTGANTPANPVRSFSSSQANRENNNANTNTTAHHHGQTHYYSNHHFASGHRFQTPIAANLNFYQQTSRIHNHQPLQQDGTVNGNGAKSPPKHSELSKNAWDAINGQDARAVFPFLHEMRRQGFYADAALSSRIVTQFLNLNNPQDAERALALLVDCYHSQGRKQNFSQNQVFVALAREIVNYSSDFSQALSVAKLLDRHDLLAFSELADRTLRTYRQLKASTGLESIKAMLDCSDLEALLAMQATLTKSSIRYRHLIEILLDGKEMDITPSEEACSKISLSFMTLGDYSGQLAWDTAVQEIYPGFKPNIPDNFQVSQDSPQQRQQQQEKQSRQSQTHYRTQAQHQHKRQVSHGNSSTSNRRSLKMHDAQGLIALRYGDPSEAIIRACRFGYAAVALEEISKMIKNDQLPSPQAIADTIQVCAKREKERATNYHELYDIARRSLDTIQDKTHRRAAEYEVYNAMLVANATLGDMKAAKKNYDDIVQLGQFPDATGYATLLIATTTGAVDEAHDALRILEEVKRHNIKPNIFFYNVVIGKLSRGRKIDRVLEVYEDMIMNKIRPNAITYGTLISACTRVGSEEMARNLFKEMTNSPNYHPRQGPHNAMIQFYVRQKKDREAALVYYRDMLDRKLSPTEHTYTLLIEAFACIPPYDMTEANRLVHSLKNGPIQATESHYGALIHAYGVEHRDVCTAEVVFNNMLQAGIMPKGPAYQSMIESHIINRDVRRAIELRNELVASGHPSSTYIENTLIRGFGQAQDILAAEQIFNGMADSHSSNGNTANVIVKEPSTFQSMVFAYLENNMLDQAYATLDMMKEQHYPELVIKPVEEAIHAVYKN